MYLNTPQFMTTTVFRYSQALILEDMEIDCWWGVRQQLIVNRVIQLTYQQS